MFQTIAHLWKDRELRRKLGYTLLLLLLVRLVSHTPMPGVNLEALSQVFDSNQFLGLLDLFSGGSLNRFSIAMMGVGPYINASIIMNLMTMAVPSIEALSKEGDYGRRKIAQYTRYLTVPLGIIQAYGMMTLLQRSDVNILGNLSSFELVSLMLIVTFGTVVIMWLGELISEFGIGNGISLIIFASILSAAPSALTGTLALFDITRIVSLAIFAVLALVTIYLIVYIGEGQRNIPISYAGRATSNRLYGGQSSYLPLRVNQAGVIPIIFALSLLLFPSLLASFFAAARTDWIADSAAWIQRLFENQTFYGVAYFVLVVAFTFFYTWVIFKPETVAENIQKSGGFVPGIRPGKQTVDFLSHVSNRLTLAGALFLGLIAILPLLVQAGTGITTLTLGGTGLLIVVSVALEFMRQIRAQLIMKRYDAS